MSSSKPTRKINTNHIPKNLSMSVDDISEKLEVHQQTVRRWFKEGLKKIDNKRPCLVHSEHLREFLKKKQAKHKVKCKPNQLYCMSCRKARSPKDNKVRIDKKNNKLANLKAQCEVCGSHMNKTINVPQERHIRVLFDVIEKLEEQHIVECTDASDKTHLKQIDEMPANESDNFQYKLL